MTSAERVLIPILSRLIPQGIRPGTVIVVEFDPESQWFSLATTIAVRHVLAGGPRTAYLARARPREEVRNDMSQLGLDVSANERMRKLVVHDWYSATLGLEKGISPKEAIETVQTENGSYSLVHSLRISDLSVQWLKEMKEGIDQAEPGALLIDESASVGLRFNEEKPYLEWFETRVNPGERRAKRIALQGLVRGTHSELFYRRMEAAADGVIEVRVMEREEKIKNMIRVRGFRREPHDTGWHEIEIKPNGEALLVT